MFIPKLVNRRGGRQVVSLVACDLPVARIDLGEQEQLIASNILSREGRRDPGPVAVVDEGGGKRCEVMSD